jgi:hypothetical protein
VIQFYLLFICHRAGHSKNAEHDDSDWEEVPDELEENVKELKSRRWQAQQRRISTERDRARYKTCGENISAERKASRRSKNTKHAHDDHDDDSDWEEDELEENVKESKSTSRQAQQRKKSTEGDRARYRTCRENISAERKAGYIDKAFRRSKNTKHAHDGDDSDWEEEELEENVKELKSRSHNAQQRRISTERDRARYKTYRENMSAEKKAEYREKARLRMQRYRVEHKPEKKPSPAEKKKLRKKWRLAKRRQREGMTPTKKAESEKRSLQRKLNALSPSVLEQLLQNTTPRKQKYLKNRCILNSPTTAKRLRVNTDIAEAFKAGLRHLQDMRNSEARAKMNFLGSVARQSKSVSRVQEELNICFRSWRKYGMVSEEASLLELQARKQRSDGLKDELKKKVIDFFAGHSFALPSKRYAAKSVLTDTTKCLHKEFTEAYKELEISFSAFKKLRPTHMLTVDKMKFIGCVCEYCINVEYAVSIHC